MTAPSYSTDLQTVTLCDDTGTWDEMTGRSSGGGDTLEDRAYIQGNYCISQSTGVATGRTTGLEFDYGSNISWTSGWVFYVWQYWQAPIAIGAWADGGMRFAVGDASGNFYAWNTMGNDTHRNPYGGWQNTAVDPEYTPDETIGTAPTAGNYRWFGSTPYILSAVSKGNPHCVDAIRYGRGTIEAIYGEGGDYATFAGMAAANDIYTARWGIFAYQQGSYLFKGVLSLGTDSNAVNFVDANRSIVINDTPRTYLDFNRIEIRNASSVVSWSNIGFKSICTLSPGRLEVVANATVDIDGCSFQDMDTFIFLSNSDVTNTIFKTCKTVTAAGGLFTGCSFLTPSVAADASALNWNISDDLDGLIDGSVFSKGTNAHHAIELGASSTNTLTIRDVTFTGFNASDGQNDSVLYLADKGSDTTWTIGCVKCTGTVSYKKARAGDSVTITQGVQTAINVKDISTLANIQGARVLVYPSDGTGPMHYQASVTQITRSGSTATVSQSAHGLGTGDKVYIQGANEAEYNGIHQITYIDTGSYSYTVSGTPDSPATGTITETDVLISDTTDSNGNVGVTRTFSGDQPITGRVREGTDPTPNYKTSPITGTVDSSDGFSTTIFLVPD